jgi:hypothetical protein
MMLNAQKADVERWVGDHFVDWYNDETGAHFSYAGRPDRAPDLLYRDGGAELVVEVAEIHFDARSAQVLWGELRGDPRAPTEWGSPNAVDRLFVTALNRVLEAKCGKAYPPSTVLVLYHYSPFAPPSRMAEHLARVTMPGHHPFRAIYFSASLPSTGAESGGYRCWQLA